MSTQIKVEAVTKEPREWKGQLSWGVKIPDTSVSPTGWITFYRAEPPKRGEVLEVNITQRHAKNGVTYIDAFPIMPPLVQLANQPAQQNGAEPVTPKKDERLTWDDYRELAKAAHSLALLLEPDEYGEEIAGQAVCRTDRSPARAAIMNTALIAFSNGKFIVPKEDDEYVAPPEDDNVPF